MSQTKSAIACFVVKSQEQIRIIDATGNDTGDLNKLHRIFGSSEDSSVHGLPDILVAVPTCPANAFRGSMRFSRDSKRSMQRERNVKMRKLALFALTLAALLFSFKTVSASDPITGKWTFVFDTQGGPREFTADLKLDGDQVSGKFAEKAEVKESFKDEKIELAFPFESPEANMTDTLKITGKLEKEALAGNWTFSEYSGTYKARRN